MHLLSIMVLRASIVLALVAPVACGGDRSATRDSIPRAATTAPVPRPPSDPNCPRDGLWHPCGLEDRMIKAGLGFRASGDTTRIASLTVPGVVYNIGKTTRFIAFYYADSSARRRDVGALDMLRFTTPGDSANPWPSRPTIITSANLLGVLLDAGPTQSERIELAITAGAPQPPSPDMGGTVSKPPARLDSVYAR